MINISTDLIQEAVYNLCVKANTCLNDDIYLKILNAYKNSDTKEVSDYLRNILINAKTAYETNMPLCQDTGQVVVFLEIGQNVKIDGDFIYDAINNAVEKCYKENFFRKSVVKNAVFDRQNTNTNTPCIIYTKYTNEDDIKIKVLIKGAGSENKSKLEMLMPTTDREELIKKCADIVLSAGINACPPMFIGIGIAGTAENALLISKEALVQTDFTQYETALALEIQNAVNEKAPKPLGGSYVLDVKIKTEKTHIACMPAGITINCHSDRYSAAIISENDIQYEHKVPQFIDFEQTDKNTKEIYAEDINTLKNLKKDEHFLLTGEILVARDMAHKKLTDIIKQKKQIPFDLTDKIIFYAGPCPNPPDRVIGSIGPTTSERMDKYAIESYKSGIFATIGKGTRQNEVIKYITENKKKYYTVQGGIAALLAQRVKKAGIIAFKELGAEAVYKIYVEKFPLKNETE